MLLQAGPLWLPDAFNLTFDACCPLRLPPGQSYMKEGRVSPWRQAPKLLLWDAHAERLLQGAMGTGGSGGHGRAGASSSSTGGGSSAARGAVGFAAEGQGARLRLEGLSIWSVGATHALLQPQHTKQLCAAAAAHALRWNLIAAPADTPTAAAAVVGNSGRQRCSSSGGSAGGEGSASTCSVCAQGRLAGVMEDLAQRDADSAHLLSPQPGSILLAASQARLEVERCR